MRAAEDTSETEDCLRGVALDEQGIAQIPAVAAVDTIDTVEAVVGVSIRVLGIATVAVCALSGCGGTGATASIRATESSYFAALTKRDARTACRDVTAHLWVTQRAEINTFFRSMGDVGRAPQRCVAGLSFVFHNIGGSWGRRPGSLERLTIRGNRATAVIVKGSLRTPSVFLRGTDGRWRIDCCTNLQLVEES